MNEVFQTFQVLMHVWKLETYPVGLVLVKKGDDNKKNELQNLKKVEKFVPQGWK